MRKRRAKKRILLPDPRFGSTTVTRFVNNLMLDGKKNTAFRVLYSALDIVKEKIAVLEARKLGIPTFAMVDTNSDPNLVDFPIPSNDDASKSIDIILSYVAKTIEEALGEREMEKKESNTKSKEKK